MKAAVEVVKQLGVDEGEHDIVKYYMLQMDGYELAKELETYADWTININDVKTLDQMGTIVDDLYQKECERWEKKQ